jgi:thiol-disulfide isomerase/thioredoxin
MLTLIALLLAVVAEPPALDDAEAALARTHGVVVPRPADAEARRRLGYPPAREASVVLAEIDALSASMREIAATDEAWKAGFRDFRAMQRRRVSLVSELEEAGYEGPRLNELLALKLEDVGRVYRAGEWPWASFGALRSEIATRYPDTPVAAEARALAMLDRISTHKRAGFRIHPADYDAIADVELGWRHHEDAGLLLLEALHGARDEALERRWHDWILENLPPTSRGYRRVKRERMFGAPIRLQGQGLRGEPIDTAAWSGDVILVDFWGMWCVPCIAAMPHLEEMRDRYEDRGLRIVGVLVDHEFDRALTFLAERGYPWPQIIWPEATAENYLEHPVAHEYAVGGFPTLWVIDRNGILREEVDRDRLEETVLRYLDER